MPSKLTHTVKGPIASFRSADIAPIESLKLHFLPKQEGSGDPSPTNIRPITGWTGCNGFRCKKNKAKFCQELLDEDREQNGITFHALSDSSVHIEGTATATAYLTRGLFQNDQYLRLLKAGTYTLSSNLPTKVNGVNNGCTLYMYGWDVDGENVGTFAMLNNGVSKKTFTLAKDTYTNIQMGITKDNTFDDDVWVQLSIGQNELDYEDNFEELIPITFPDGQTIYGGYVDPVRGKLIAEWYKWHITSSDIPSYGGFDGPYTNNDHNRYRLYSNTMSPLPLPGSYGYGTSSVLMCDKFKIQGEYYPFENHITFNSNNRIVIGVPYEYDTKEKALNWLDAIDGVDVVYKLETPIEYDIAPISLETFLDHNNFWSDTNDDTEVEYTFRDHLIKERRRIYSFNLGEYIKLKGGIQNDSGKTDFRCTC